MSEGQLISVRRPPNYDRPMICRRRYRVSFSTGGLCRRESIDLANLFQELKNWNLVRKTALSDNLLQTRTTASSKRLIREIISRLNTLNPCELALLEEGSPQEQGHILWIATCRTYPLIAEFAIELLRENFLSIKSGLLQKDFDHFFNKKSELHVELEEIQPSTRKKLRQVLFRMLREADLLDSKDNIKAAILSPRLLETLQNGKRRDVLFFPVCESEVRGMAR